MLNTTFPRFVLALLKSIVPIKLPSPSTIMRSVVGYEISPPAMSLFAVLVKEPPEPEILLKKVFTK